jgi:hypothetical protein
MHLNIYQTDEQFIIKKILFESRSFILSRLLNMVTNSFIYSFFNFIFLKISRDMFFFNSLTLT